MKRHLFGILIPAAGVILAVFVATVAITTQSDTPAAKVQTTNKAQPTLAAQTGQAAGSSTGQRMALCSGSPDGVQAGVEVDFAVPLITEELSKYSPYIAVVTPRGKGPSECAGNPPSIYTELQLQVETVLVDKSGAPETAKHLLIGGSVGKDTLTVEGGYPREVAVGQRYVIYAHPMEGSPNSLLIDVAMPIAEQGRVVERAGTDEERRVPLEEAIRIITAGAAQTKWPIEP